MEVAGDFIHLTSDKYGSDSIFSLTSDINPLIGITS